MHYSESLTDFILVNLHVRCCPGSKGNTGLTQVLHDLQGVRDGGEHLGVGLA